MNLLLSDGQVLKDKCLPFLFYKVLMLDLMLLLQLLYSIIDSILLLLIVDLITAAAIIIFDARFNAAAANSRFDAAD